MPGSGMPNSLVPQGVIKTGMLPVVASFAMFGSIESPPHVIRGVTRDSTGAVLAGCTVFLFRTSDNSYVSSSTSDANGNYVLPASPLLQHYVVAYLVGSPDVSGVTLNTLLGA